MNSGIGVEKTDKPRPRWSTVWLHCTDLKNGKAMCNLCGTGLAYHSHISKSTYNLKRHLRLKHPTVIMPRRHKSSSMMWKFRREEDSKRSSVWAHCTIIGDKKVRCDLCKAELVYLNGSTHNLKRHLEAKHTAEEMQNYSKSHKAEQEMQELINMNAKRMSNGSRSLVLSSAITEALNGYAEPTTIQSACKWADDDSDCEFVAHKPLLSLTKQRYFDDALVDTLALDFQPTAIVNDIGFREFVAQLQPLYVLPHQRTVTKTLFPQRFERLVHRRQMELQHIHAICLSIETWNRINSSDKCFAVTAHFIGQQFELKSCALDCFRFSNQQTITYVKDELMRIAEEWHIQDKIVAVVTDNTIEVLTAIDLIGWPRLPCFVDTLNSIASEALLEIDEILIKIRSTVEYFRFNAAATEMLRSLLQQMEMIQIDLESDFGMNWVSSFKMMHRFFELREPIVNLMALIGEPVLQTLTWSDWDVVARACELLMPLYETTAELSSDNYMSASKAIVIVRGLQRLFRDQLALPGHPPTIEKMASIIMSSLTNWFGNMELNPLLAESTLLDPRFKMTGFADLAAANVAKRNVIESASRAVLNSDLDKGDTASNTSQSGVAVLEDFADAKKQQTVSSIWAEYDKKVSGITDDLNSHHCLSSIAACASIGSKTVCASDSAVSSVWSDYDQKVSNIAVSEKPETEAAKQMQRFLDEPLLGRLSSSYEWWQAREALYPRLVPVVKERLCIVASSVSSEFAFSRTSQISSIRRHSLSSREMRFQFFLHSNV